jgi:hypothetical protein
VADFCLKLQQFNGAHHDFFAEISPLCGQSPALRRIDSLQCEVGISGEFVAGNFGQISRFWDGFPERRCLQTPGLDFS